MISSDYPADLDWGNVTPEGYNDATREALHVLNVKLVGETNRSLVLRFVCARIQHFARHLPLGSTQKVRFDLRGQMIDSGRLDAMRAEIVEQGKSSGVAVTVEFLTN